jgi:GMP synthase-like glutamine amidotransferase
MHRPLRIGLLLAGHVDPASRHIAGDYPELFGELFEPEGVTLVPYAVDAGALPHDTDECDGWICSPSRASVYDDLPWLPALSDLLVRFVEDEAPFLGICFGHQLLAQALGGRVERHDDGWGVGVHEYDVIRALPWIDDDIARVALIASHQDQVVDLPTSARPWATSDFCRHAGFTVGDHAWTIQTHPEFVPALADHLLAGRIELIGADRVNAARQSLGRDLSRRAFARWATEFFSRAN